MDLTTLTSREIQDLITFYSFERRKVEYQLSKIDENLTELKAKLGINTVTTTLEKPVDTTVESTTVILEVEETKKEIKTPEIKKEEDVVKPKRGRGRPKKNKEVEAKKVEKVTEAVVEEIKKEEEVVKPKRGRGRPKKNKEVEAKKVEKVTETVVEEIKKEEEVVKPKRGRGRPKKNKEVEAKKEEKVAEAVVEELKKEEEVVKPKRGRGRPRKNKQPEAEQKTVIEKEEIKKEGIKSKKELGKNKKRKKKPSKEKKRIPLAPRLKYSKELKEREQRIAAETVKKSQAEKADAKEDVELFFSDLDNLILETIRLKSRLVNRYEFDEIVKNWAKAQHMKATEDQLYRKISKSLHRLTSAKYSLIRKYRVEGGPRLFAYGDANWFFKKTGKIKKQYQDKLAQ